MENKKFIKNIIIFIYLTGFIFGGFSALAQSSGKNFFIKETEAGATFYQHLSWESSEDVLAFIVCIESKSSDDKWQLVEEVKTELTYIDKSLPPGDYRYRIKVINLLGQLAFETKDTYFTILVAHQPVVTSVSPKVIYFDTESNGVLDIDGSNFFESTTFFMQVQDNESSKISGSVLNLSPDGTSAKVLFDIKNIALGTYTFFAVDPSSLYDRNNTVAFKFQKPVDFYISGGYAFIAFPKSGTVSKYFGTDIAPLSATIRLLLVPIKLSWGSFGFGLSGSASLLNRTTPDYKLKATMFLTNFHFSFLKWLIPNRLSFDVHVGAGAEFMTGVQFVFSEVSSPKRWFWGISANTGVALQVFMYKRLYAEIGLDYILGFGEDFPTHILQPSLSIGWRF